MIKHILHDSYIDKIIFLVNENKIIIEVSDEYKHSYRMEFLNILDFSFDMSRREDFDEFGMSIWRGKWIPDYRTFIIELMAEDYYLIHYTDIKFYQLLGGQYKEVASNVMPSGENDFGRWNDDGK